MKLQKTTHFQAMMKKSFFWRFLYENFYGEGTRGDVKNDT